MESVKDCKASRKVRATAWKVRLVMGWGRFRQPTWSQCEIDHLKAHKTDSVNQLSGYLGKSRAAINNKLIELETGKAPDKKKSKRTNIGKRKDLGDLFVRSSWEANVARYLNYHGYSWEYEPHIFVFEGIKHGTTSFCPDFKVQNGWGHIWIEVKGQLDSQDKTRIRRFKKMFPDEFKRLQCIVGTEKTAAAKFFQLIGVPIMVTIFDLNKRYKDVIENWE